MMKKQIWTGILLGAMIVALPLHAAAAEEKTMPVEAVQAETVELVRGPVWTEASVPAVLELFSFGEEADPNAVRWIDRVALGPEANAFYQMLEESCDHDGYQDYLTDQTYFQPGLALSAEMYQQLQPGDWFTVDEQTTAVLIAVMDQDPETVNEENAQLAVLHQQIFKAWNAFSRDHPEVFWLGSAAAVSRVTLQYPGAAPGEIEKVEHYVFLCLHWLDREGQDQDLRAEGYRGTDGEEALYKAIAQRDADVQKILQDPDYPAEGTDAEKVRFFNHWLVSNNEYNTTGSGEFPLTSYRCTTALAGSTGAEGPVCEGYAKAFAVLCGQAGIPCVLTDGQGISSSGQPEAHMWNSVCVDDRWYGVDVTWNDPASENAGAVSGLENEAYLLVGSKTQIGQNGLLAFEKSHIVINQVSQEGGAFPRGPELNQTASGAVRQMNWQEKVATCEQPGLRTGVFAEKLGIIVKDEVVLPALGHELMWEHSEKQHWQVCSRCGHQTDPVPHSWQLEETETGKQYRCVCGETMAVGIPITGLAFEQALYTLNPEKGQTLVLCPTATPTDTTEELHWSSSNTAVAEVDKNGRVMPHRVGETTVTVTTDSGKTASTKVQVRVETLAETAVQVNGQAPIEQLPTGQLQLEIRVDLSLYAPAAQLVLASYDANGRMTGIQTMLCSAGETVHATVDNRSGVLSCLKALLLEQTGGAPMSRETVMGKAAQ